MERPLIPYIRQSRTDEATISFEDQWDAIERWASSNGTVLSVGTLVEAEAAGLVERNTSGNSYWRERELGRAIAACRCGEAAGIVVHDQSRFTREKLLHTVEAWDALVEQAGATAGRAGYVAWLDNSSVAEIQTGDFVVDMDGHLWKVLRVGPDAVVLRGRGATAEFPLVDGVIVSDREFCPATLPGGRCLHGFPGGRGCPDCDSDAEAPGSTSARSR